MQNHKIRACGVNDLYRKKIRKNSYIIAYIVVVYAIELTFLNISRVPEMLPSPSRTTAF